MATHIELMQLIVGYALAGAFAFTVIITCCSIVGWIKFADRAQQKTMFKTLIVELVVIGLGFFGGVLKFDPQEVERKIREVEQYKDLSTGLGKFVFAVEILHEFLSNQWTTKSSMVASVTEYNAAITKLRNDEASSLQLLRITEDTEDEAQFKAIMRLVAKIDKSIHGLNDELEKVSILGTQQKITPGRATETAGELKPLLVDLDSKVNTLLRLGGPG